MKARVLVVDDAIFMRKMISDILEGNGMEIVGEAETGALGQQALVQDALSAGAKDFLIKPFNPSRVIEVISKVLNQVPTA